MHTVVLAMALFLPASLRAMERAWPVLDITSGILAEDLTTSLQIAPQHAGKLSAFADRRVRKSEAVSARWELDEEDAILSGQSDDRAPEIPRAVMCANAGGDGTDAAFVISAAVVSAGGSGGPDGNREKMGSCGNDISCSGDARSIAAGSCQGIQSVIFSGMAAQAYHSIRQGYDSRGEVVGT